MALILTIKVTPRSGRQVFVWDVQRCLLKCYLKNAPERNKANAELCKLLQKKLGLQSEQISIIAGYTARQKKIKIEADFTLTQICERLGVSVQQTVF